MLVVGFTLLLVYSLTLLLVLRVTLFFAHRQALFNLFIVTLPFVFSDRCTLLTVVGLALVVIHSATFLPVRHQEIPWVRVITFLFNNMCAGRRRDLFMDYFAVVFYGRMIICV